MGLKPIVVINKVDRSDARPTEVANEVFDLFAALDATEEQLDFPILYGSAKQGWMAESPEGPKDRGMAPLFDLVLRHVAPPQVEDGPFRMLGTILEANPYLGRIVTGRIFSGSIKPNQPVKVLDPHGDRGRGRPRDEGSRLPRPRTRADRRGLRRRYHRHCRPAGGVRVAYAVRARGDGTVAGTADRSADAGDDVPHQ